MFETNSLNYYVCLAMLPKQKWSACLVKIPKQRWNWCAQQIQSRRWLDSLTTNLIAKAYHVRRANVIIKLSPCH